jgi:hypothetical protein
MKAESKPALELWKQAEILAIDKGISVTDFVEEAYYHYL